MTCELCEKEMSESEFVIDGIKYKDDIYHGACFPKMLQILVDQGGITENRRKGLISWSYLYKSTGMYRRASEAERQQTI